MLHPSYTDLMKVVNSEVEPGETPVVNSRYSIVMATAKRARQIIAGEAVVTPAQAAKPLSTAVAELNQGKIKILPETEEDMEEEAAAAELTDATETAEAAEMADVSETKDAADMADVSELTDAADMTGASKAADVTETAEEQEDSAPEADKEAPAAEELD